MVKSDISWKQFIEIIKLVFLMRIDQCVRKDLNLIENFNKIHF